MEATTKKRQTSFYLYTNLLAYFQQEAKTKHRNLDGVDTHIIPTTIGNKPFDGMIKAVNLYNNGDFIDSEITNILIQYNKNLIKKNAFMYKKPDNTLSVVNIGTDVSLSNENCETLSKHLIKQSDDNYPLEFELLDKDTFEKVGTLKMQYGTDGKPEFRIDMDKPKPVSNEEANSSKESIQSYRDQLESEFNSGSDTDESFKKDVNEFLDILSENINKKSNDVSESYDKMFKINDNEDYDSRYDNFKHLMESLIENIAEDPTSCVIK